MPRGGFRAGSGRPKGSIDLPKLDLSHLDLPSDPNSPVEVADPNLLPLDFALKVMRDPSQPAERRDRMAMALLPYLHKRIADQRPTVKDAKRQAAAAAGKSRFAPSAPPKLKVVGEA